MKIFIADDMETDRAELHAVLRKWSEKKGTACDITEFSSGEELVEKSRSSPPQLAILDIYMGGENGIAAARSLREISRGCLIVFLTSSREHTWEAFPLHPFDYIVKPWEEKTMFHLLEEAALCLNEDITVEFTSGRQKLHIRASDIGYAASDNHHVLIVTKMGDRIKSYSSFSTVSKQLESDGSFIACNRGVIVNMDFIDKCLETSFLLKNGDSIPIRLKDICELRRIYAEYTFRSAKRWG